LFSHPLQTGLKGETQLMKRTLTILFAAALCALGIFSAVAFGADGVPVVSTTTTTSVGTTTTPATTATTTTTTSTTPTEDHGKLCKGKRVHVLGSLVALTDTSVSLTVVRSSGNRLAVGAAVTFLLNKKVKVSGKHHPDAASAPVGSLVALEGAACDDGTYQAKNVVIQLNKKGENGQGKIEEGKTHHGKGESTPPVSTTPDTQTTPSSQSGDASKGHHGGKK
jgi:hypothetical protein